MNRSTLRRFTARLVAPLLATALLLAGCSATSERERADQAFRDAFSSDPAVAELSVASEITRPAYAGQMPGWELRTVDDLDCSDVADIVHRMIEVGEDAGDAAFPMGTVALVVDDVQVNFSRDTGKATEVIRQLVEFVCAVRDDQGLDKAYIQENEVRRGTFSLDLVMPRYAGIPGAYERWRGPFSDFPAGNGNLSIVDDTWQYILDEDLADWERMDLAHLVTLLDDFGVSYFNQRSGSLSVEIAPDADVEAATAAFAPYADEHADFTVERTDSAG